MSYLEPLESVWSIFKNGPGAVQKVPITYTMPIHLSSELGHCHNTLIWHATVSLGIVSRLREAFPIKIPISHIIIKS